MAKNWALYILLAWIVVPAAATVAVLIIGSTVSPWSVLFLSVTVVFFVQFVISACIRKKTLEEGLFKSKRDFGMKLFMVFIKAVVFTLGVCMTMYSFFVNGGQPFVFSFPYISQDVRYISIVIGTWIAIGLLNSLPFRGE